jgi:hypothetical protein
LLEELLKTEAWQDILGPHLYDSISSSIGRQSESGKWIPSLSQLPKATNDERCYAAGYAAGLMEFANFLVDTIESKNTILENKKNEVEEEAKSSQLIHPMEEEI